MKTIIKSVEICLPEKVVSNDDLSKFLDTSHEWIFTRTGIERRHVVEQNGEGELTSDLATKAAIKALQSAGLDAFELDAIIVSTTTSDRRFPSVATKVQGNIGASKAFCFDVNAACSGFIYGLAVCDSLIKTRALKNVLLIGADTLSLFVDWTDRSTCVLFGDGAGAVVLNGSENSDGGIIATKLLSDGTKFDFIVSENGPQNNHRGSVSMMGRAVFKYAIEYMADSMEDILKENNMTLDDIDWIVPHQANRRIIESLCKLRGFPSEKVVISIHDHANTSAASIPLAIKYGIEEGKIKKGQTLLLTAFGAGLTWGSAIVKL